ncbi:hypothetical protein PRK78_000632 [Emydomyces testavorans]|uniref:Protein kinase domain-containing protein n=1 Tax=Emydomyces testavorans TaxID=2070801 RepID=A0AAF0DBK1_9EURO|nr:hypothetical protein PRK78_000632 [Emydomyces testavorans]
MAIAPPFSSLTIDDQIGVGTASVVYNINDMVAFKCPIQFANTDIHQSERHASFRRRQSEMSVNALENEKEIFTILEKSPHPNIVRCFCIANEGIFLEHLTTSLNTYLESGERVSPSLGARWLLQLTSAAAWIEKLGFAHGDLRPENILLTQTLDLKLVDFDCAVTPGGDLLGLAEPYWINKPDGSLDRAGPKSEQFALASCLYFIFNQREPTIDIVDGQLIFPDLSSTPFAPLIRKCWNGGFSSLRKLAFAALWNVAKAGNICVLFRFLYSNSIGFEKSMTSQGKLGPLRRFCEDYLDEQRRNHMASSAAQPINIRRC